MDEGSVSGASARGLALTTATPAGATKDTHDNVDSTSGLGNAANNNSGSSNNNNSRYLSNLSDCQNVSSSGGVGGAGHGGSSELVVTPTITHIKQSPTSPSPMSSGGAEATTVALQQQQQHHLRQSDELMYGGPSASTPTLVTHPHSTLSTLDMAHQQQVHTHTHAHAQQHHHLHQQQQQQSQHLQRLGSLSNINISATNVAAGAADTVSGSRGSVGVGAGAITQPSLLSERPPPPPYSSSSSSSAAIMTSKVLHAGSCATTSMEGISGDERPVATPTTRLSAYEQFLKLSAQEYATTTSADNAAVLNLSSIGKAPESDLMLRHVNVAAAMAAAAVGNVGAVEGSAVVGANGCERN